MRKANLIQTGIWDDEAFDTLTRDAQFLYLFLITQSTVMTTGLLPVRRRYWSRKLFSGDPGHLDASLAELADAVFVWLDETTEELVIRSWVKHNVQKSPNMEKGARDALHGISSKDLRNRLVDAYPTVFGTTTEPTPNPSETPSKPVPAKTSERLVVGNRELVVGDRSSTEDRRARADAVNVIWAEFEQRSPRSAFTRQRRATLETWLKTYPVETLVAAIIGNHLDPHCNGDNDRGQQYHSFELIFRDAKHIEEYAHLAHTGPPQRRLKGAEATLQLAHEALAIQRNINAAS